MSLFSNNLCISINEGYFGNFKLAGSLASLIPNVLNQNNDDFKLKRHQSVYERFSWDKIHLDYFKMINHCAKYTN
ncbi:MAG: hypothetical protein ACKPJO_19910 [Dolichospermum sp.]